MFKQPINDQKQRNSWRNILDLLIDALQNTAL